jgi:uncharacterized protein YjeT (DUF2065 family)
VSDLAFIGETIGTVFRSFEMLAGMLTEEELKAFDQYLSIQEGVGPILNPTAWRDMPDGSIDQARERVRIIRAIQAQQRKE